MKKIFCLILALLFGTAYSLQKFILRTDSPKKEITFFADSTKNKLNGPKRETISAFSIVMNNGEKIPTIFFDRQKDKVIVVGQGFPGIKEYGKLKARLFVDYDVVLFDYRWKDMYKFLFQFSTLYQPIDAFFFKEKDIVVTVVNFLKSHKNYKEIIALGECYSNFTFVLAQAESIKKKSGLFTKLILDSCWYDSRSFVEEISFDPWLPFKPQDGGAPNWLKVILKSSCIHFPISYLLDFFIPDIAIKPYLEKISSPILFIHGENDKMVPLKKVFEKIWQIPASEKALLITPFEHSDNMQNATAYKEICDCFINSKSNEVGSSLIKKIS